MMNSEVTNKSVRNYLLGKLSDETEMRQIEEKILLDDDFAESLAVAEEELIEQYLDDALDADEERNFNTHFLALPERRKKLNLTRNLRKYAARAESENRAEPFKKKTGFFDWRSLFAMPAVRFAAITLLAVGVGFAVWRTMIYESDVDKGLAQMRQAYRGQRPIEPRTSANLDYAPMPNTRGTNAATADDKARSRAERYLLDATENPNDAAARHALGLFYLAERKPDNALKEFDAALKLKPDDAKLLSDLGAAYLEKVKQAEIEEKGEEFFQNADAGLKNLNRALEINPNLTEALFNRALLLQKMRLTNQAREAWQKYLEKDSSSPWANEARKNLELLDQQSLAPKTKEQILQDFLEAYRQRDETRAWEIVSQTKEMVTGVMVMPQLAQNFLEANAAGKFEEASQSLAVMLYTGQLEKTKTGDSYFLDWAEFYARTDAKKRVLLSKARSALDEGYQLYLASKFKDALLRFEQSGKLFAQAGNVWESNITHYWAAFCLSRIGNVEESTKILLLLVRSCEQSSYKWLLGQAFLLLADYKFRQDEFSEAVHYCQQAIQLTNEISDSYQQQKILAFLAYIYGELAELRQAFLYIKKSFYLDASYFFSARQSWRNLFAAAQLSYQLGFYPAAVAFAKEVLEVGKENLRDPIATYSSYLLLAQMFGGIKKYSEALHFAEQSKNVAQDLEDSDMQQINSAASLLQIANLKRQSGDCFKALNYYDEAIKTYSRPEHVQYIFSSYDTHKGRLLCYRALKKETEAQTELEAVIEIFENYRARIQEEQLNNSFFDGEQNVYDIAVEDTIGRQNPTLAFDYAEKSKARFLLETLKNKAALPVTTQKALSSVSNSLSLSEVRQRMPEQVQIVQYALLENKIVVWIVSKNQFAAVEKQISENEINEQALSYLELIKAKPDDETQIRQTSARLYESLIAPILPVLDSGKEICFVPDKTLYHLPFASLINRETGKYLIEDYALFYAPSSSVFVLASESAKQKSAMQEESLLAVGNPAFDRQTFLTLPDLPSATKEAREVGGFYSQTKVFTEGFATKKNIVDEIPNAEVFHFAGHYVANEASPLNSIFLLNEKNSVRQNAGEGSLAVREIAGKQFDRTKLVVLSACQTGIERHYKGEGAIGAARTFLASGVPLVVASQWAVDSDATAELMIAFHRHRRQERLSTVAALRKAQLDLLNQTDERLRQPYRWAAFSVFGGYAEY